MRKHKDMIIMTTNSKEETKTITYNPQTKEIIKTLHLKEDYGFQIVKFKNNYYGINYINPILNINETVMISTEENEDIGPQSFLTFAEEAHRMPDIKDIDSIELVVAVDPKNSEVYRETINSDQAETLIEKMEIARELVEIERENNFWIQHGSTIIVACVLINIILAGINLFRLFNGA